MKKIKIPNIKHVQTSKNEMKFFISLYNTQTSNCIEEMTMVNYKYIVQNANIWSKKYPHIDSAEFESYFMYKLLDQLNNYDPNKATVITFISRVTRFLAVEVIRAHRVSHERSFANSFDSSDEPGIVTEAYLASDYDLENDYITKGTAKSDAQKRALIDELISAANLDPIFVTMIERFLSGEFPTIGEAANAMSIHRQTAQRAVQKLAAQFDPKKHGELADYFIAH